MKHWAFVLILFLIPLVFSQPLKPVSVNITVQLDKNSPVKGIETYYFPLSAEENLLNLSRDLGSRYILWKSYIDGLIVHGCREKDAKDVTIVLKKEKGTPVILLTYQCPPPRKVGEDFFSETFTYDAFRFPVVGGLMQVPDGYTLVAELPPKSKVISVVPTPSKVGEEVVWRGPLSSAAQFSVTYRVPKVYTAPSIAHWLTIELSDPRISLSLLALLIILYAAKDKIKKRVVQWVSSTTEITKE